MTQQDSSNCDPYCTIRVSTVSGTTVVVVVGAVGERKEAFSVLGLFQFRKPIKAYS